MLVVSLLENVIMGKILTAYLNIQHMLPPPSTCTCSL